MRQWRVGSITLGVTLILIGITCILGNIYDLTLVGKIIKWWPVILIIFGIEILVSNTLSEKNLGKLKFDGLSGFLILIILGISGVLFIGSHIFNFNKEGINIRGFNNINYKFESKFTKQQVIDPKTAKKLIISSDLANINLEKSSKQVIEVNSDIRILNNDEKEAKKIADSIIKVSQGEDIRIDTQKDFKNNSNYSVSRLNINIKIPEKIYSEVTNEYGSISAKNIGNGIKVKNSNGNINLNSISGDVICENTYGKIEVDIIKGKVEIKNKNGSIKVKNIEKDLGVENEYGTINVEDVNGNVITKNSNGNIRIINVGGNVKAQDQYGLIYLKNIKKNVEVENKNAKIDVQDIFGDFKCENDYGNIKAVNILGKVDINSGNGSVEFKNSNIVNKDLKIINEGGSVKMTFAKEQKGHFILESTYGRIHSRNLDLNPNKTEEVESVDKVLGNDSVKIKVTNKNGSINIYN
ncbi:hypothetical protein [Clostridium brassicae]|uniref:RRM domain-containing protein n=1 Tax=Clostridium brassicae TaxID=2999072 RepID=A0ABT4DAJ6_9CLOT|nr:hypothetical protein [Clostridium brassicae]MCY6958683.1 hypothetical protein [Clostridium brassicae]